LSRLIGWYWKEERRDCDKGSGMDWMEVGRGRRREKPRYGVLVWVGSPRRRNDCGRWVCDRDRDRGGVGIETGVST
jgi:hypothetical protein